MKRVLSATIDDLAPLFERALQGFYYGTPSRAISFYPKLIYHWMSDHPKGFEQVLAMPEETIKSMLGLWLAQHGVNGSWTTRPKNFQTRPFRLVRTQVKTTFGYIEAPLVIQVPKAKP